MRALSAFWLGWALATGALAQEAPLPVAAEGGIRASLTGRPGDPARGAALAADPTRASCLICHAAPIPGALDPGSIGPDLAGVADRLGEPELRLRLVDARRVNPDTVMPPYYALDGLTRVGRTWQGTTIYSAAEVEDVLAWLLTLGAP